MKVKITKIEPVDNPVVITPLEKDYICGQVQKEDVSVFNGYTVIGTLVYPIEIGRPVKLLRENRNGVEIEGIFTTSIVKNISAYSEETLFFTTDNSLYRIEYNYKG
jgi:hypothetical protein